MTEHYVCEVPILREGHLGSFLCKTGARKDEEITARAERREILGFLHTTKPFGEETRALAPVVDSPVYRKRLKLSQISKNETSHTETLSYSITGWLSTL